MSFLISLLEIFFYGVVCPVFVVGCVALVLGWRQRKQPERWPHR